MTERYQFYQCSNRECEFRFPALAGTIKHCPRCKAPTLEVPHIPGENIAITPVPNRYSMHAFLDNIRSVLNVGSMFRTADGAGIAHMHLAGISATPDHPRIAKTGLGAEWSIPWTHHLNGVTAIAALKSSGYSIWGLETVAHAYSIFSVPKIPSQLVLVVGSEYAGIDPGIQSQCDAFITIPMHGYKRSLNVAVAFGIAAYSILQAISSSND